ncbi:MAG: D-cysteine desulfhydrase family protein [Pseudomonadota bacterium]
MTVAQLHRHIILTQPTPLQHLPRLSDHLGVELHIKRDDLAGPSFGGNKARQLEYYFGAALAEKADTILITGAVQSNFVRMAAAVANSLGMSPIIQLEYRVDTTSPAYARSGNVLLNSLLGAEVMTYPEGEDETGADRALLDRGEELWAEGRRPYVIPLGQGHPPLGALGYVNGAHEILAQRDDFDAFVVGSGSAATHTGLLAGVRGAGHPAQVFGSCVRRDAARQTARVKGIMSRLVELYEGTHQVADADVHLWDGALAPGYGKVGPIALSAMKLMARTEGLIVDPVYTGKSFAAVPALIESGDIPKGSRVCFVHTGGLAGLFAYEDVLSDLMSAD